MWSPKHNSTAKHDTHRMNVGHTKSNAVNSLHVRQHAKVELTLRPSTALLRDETCSTPCTAPGMPCSISSNTGAIQSRIIHEQQGMDRADWKETQLRRLLFTALVEPGKCKISTPHDIWLIHSEVSYLQGSAKPLTPVTKLRHHQASKVQNMSQNRNFRKHTKIIRACTQLKQAMPCSNVRIQNNGRNCTKGQRQTEHDRKATAHTEVLEWG